MIANKRAAYFALAAVATLVPEYANAGNRCAFEYDESFVSEVALPLLQEHLGSALRFYRVQSPAIVAEGSVVSLMYDPTRTIDGNRLMSETTFVIEVDGCSRKPLRAYDALPPQG
jgi:hypothetical protein